MNDADVLSRKVAFLQKELIPLLQSLTATEKGRWGVMNGQQMVEHMIEMFQIANGHLAIPLFTSPDRLDKFRDFLFSDKQFRENTKNPLLGEDARPVTYPNIETAIAALKEEITLFFKAFENEPSLQTLNPIFGELDFNGNVQLLYKHSLHHLRQFGRLD